MAGDQAACLICFPAAARRGPIAWCHVAWARIVSLEWILPLTRLRSTEFGDDRRVFGAITVVSTLIYIASGLAIVVSGFRSAKFACIVVATG